MSWLWVEMENFNRIVAVSSQFAETNLQTTSVSAILVASCSKMVRGNTERLVTLLLESTHDTTHCIVSEHCQHMHPATQCVLVWSQLIAVATSSHCLKYLSWSQVVTLITPETCDPRPETCECWLRVICYCPWYHGVCDHRRLDWSGEEEHETCDQWDHAHSDLHLLGLTLQTSEVSPAHQARHWLLSSHSQVFTFREKTWNIFSKNVTWTFCKFDMTTWEECNKVCTVKWLKLMGLIQPRHLSLLKSILYFCRKFEAPQIGPAQLSCH